MTPKTAFKSAMLVAPAAIALLTLSACGGAPGFTQFHTPRGGPPLPAVENQFLNDVQHRLDRPLDNDKAVAAAVGSSFKCLTYTEPLFAHIAMPDPVVPGMSAEDRELVHTAMTMATPESGLCRAAKVKSDREHAEADADHARVEAETRAHAEQVARQKADDEAAAHKESQKRKTTTTTTTTPKQSSSGSDDDSSSSGGTSCEPGAAAKVNSQHVITNKDCPEINSAKQSAQEEYEQQTQRRSLSTPPGFREGIDGN